MGEGGGGGEENVAPAGRRRLPPWPEKALRRCQSWNDKTADPPLARGGPGERSRRSPSHPSAGRKRRAALLSGKLTSAAARPRRGRKNGTEMVGRDVSATEKAVHRARQPLPGRARPTPGPACPFTRSGASAGISTGADPSSSRSLRAPAPACLLPKGA